MDLVPSTNFGPGYLTCAWSSSNDQVTPVRGKTFAGFTKPTSDIPSRNHCAVRQQQAAVRWWQQGFGLGRPFEQAAGLPVAPRARSHLVVLYLRREKKLHLVHHHCACCPRWLTQLRALRSSVARSVAGGSNHKSSHHLRELVVPSHHDLRASAVTS